MTQQTISSRFAKANFLLASLAVSSLAGCDKGWLPGATSATDLPWHRLDNKSLFDYCGKKIRIDAKVEVLSTAEVSSEKGQYQHALKISDPTGVNPKAFFSVLKAKEFQSGQYLVTFTVKDAIGPSDEPFKDQIEFRSK